MLRIQIAFLCQKLGSTRLIRPRTIRSLRTFYLESPRAEGDAMSRAFGSSGAAFDVPKIEPDRGTLGFRNSGR